MTGCRFPVAVRAAFTLACLSIGGRAGAQTIPASTTLSVRTLDEVSADPTSLGRSVRAMVLVPVTVASRLLVAPRTLLEGTIEDSGKETSDGTRHFVRVHFASMVLVVLGDTLRIPISAQVIDVDNSRETVDAAGRILGPALPSLVRAKADWAAIALGTVNPVAGAVFFATVRGEEAERQRRVAFAPGTDMTVQLLNDAPLPAWPLFDTPQPLASDSALRSLLEILPLRATTQDGRIPGDFVNCIFIATDDQMRRAFQGAGWDSPDRMSIMSVLETFVKAAKAEGYAHQPVSEQHMFGRPPDLVFQRVTDTFAKRHHIRLWRTAIAWEGVPIWAAAATHDIGVEFSGQRRSFTHRIDDAVDGERDKVASDLVAAREVRNLSNVQRTPPPDRSASGPVTSDWRVIVMRLLETGQLVPEPRGQITR